MQICHTCFVIDSDNFNFKSSTSASTIRMEFYIYWTYWSIHNHLIWNRPSTYLLSMTHLNVIIFASSAFFQAKSIELQNEIIVSMDCPSTIEVVAVVSWTIEWEIDDIFDDSSTTLIACIYINKNSYKSIKKYGKGQECSVCFEAAKDEIHQNQSTGFRLAPTRSWEFQCLYGVHKLIAH